MSESKLDTKVKKCDKTRKSYKKKEKGKLAPLNHYAKKKILAFLQKEEIGNCETLTKKFSCDPRELEKFINMHARNSEIGVQFECNSTTLRSILSWIEGFRNNSLNTTGIKELPLVLKAISRLETHPLPVECGGVNLKELYLFLAKVMSGEPVLELNEKNRSFLCDILGGLIDDINSAEGDENVAKLRDEFLNQFSKEKKIVYLKDQMLQIGINPLMLNLH
ncbi:uncharacterized protein LOC129611544 [Condylostylus longicornis]|uniref:uncharacterized protein LOC129611544 n=1 Tax=Condylostylus longicornis TaxID=2530218 RepID=UPI00244DC1C3|nr:uncharacterized protein LOC129611544 [Condylostylus longicornis]